MLGSEFCAVSCSITPCSNAPELSNNIIQKRLAFDRDWSGTVLTRARKAHRAPAPLASWPTRGFGGAARRCVNRTEDLMSKAAKKSSPSSKVPVIAVKPSLSATDDTTRPKADPGSKQSRVIAMLQSPHGGNDRSNDEDHGLAGALGARFSCRRGAQTPQVETQLEEGGWQPGLPDCWRRQRQDGRSPDTVTLKAMPRVKIGPALPDRSVLNVEIAHLRDLDISGLRAHWHSVFRRRPPPQLPRHLLYRVLAYRLQAERLGDLDSESQRLLDRSGSPEKAGHRAVDLSRCTASLRPGTMLGREWNGQVQRVAVLADGFAWNGKTYPSLSKVAFAITGTRWNGPKFFGLRDKSSRKSPS
jgi:hypothetical protein